MRARRPRAWHSFCRKNQPADKRLEMGDMHDNVNSRAESVRRRAFNGRRCCPLLLFVLTAAASSLYEVDTTTTSGSGSGSSLGSELSLRLGLGLEVDIVVEGGPGRLGGS